MEIASWKAPQVEISFYVYISHGFEPISKSAFGVSADVIPLVTLLMTYFGTIVVRWSTFLFANKLLRRASNHELWFTRGAVLLEQCTRGDWESSLQTIKALCSS